MKKSKIKIHPFAIFWAIIFIVVAMLCAGTIGAAFPCEPYQAKMNILFGMLLSGISLSGVIVILCSASVDILEFQPGNDLFEETVNLEVKKRLQEIANKIKEVE